MRTEQKGAIKVSKDLADDPNDIAYQAAVSSGQFESLEAGTYVAFYEGQLIGTGMDQEKLFQELGEKGITGFLYQQVGIPERVVHLRSPRIVRGSGE